MADDWAPGDLAIRVTDARTCKVCGLRTPHEKGAIREVEEVGYEEYDDDGPGWVLHFVEEERRTVSVVRYEGELVECVHEGFGVEDYRKIPPLDDEERDAYLAGVKRDEQQTAPVREPAGDGWHRFVADNGYIWTVYWGPRIEMPFLPPNRHDRGHR